MTYVSGDILYQSIAKIAATYNAMGALSIAAYDFENKFSAADAALVFDNTNLTAVKGASIFNETALTVAKLISILDNANILSAKIKSIFDTGLLSVDEKRAATLEGDQYAAADAAASVNNTFYTDDQLALAFNNANLTAAKGASIFNETALSITKINDIIIHDNITDSKAQEILNATSYATRDLTSATSILYAIHDDWADNKLTSRDTRATTAAGVLGDNEFAQNFRPEWTTVTGTPSVASGVLSLNENDDVKTPSTFDVGAWQIHENLPDEAGFYFHIMRYDADNTIKFHIDRYSGDELTLQKVDGGSTVNLISYSWVGAAGDIKVTYDGSGNWEIFDETGASRGTASDEFIPTGWDCIYLAGVNGTSAIDNLEVY